MLILSFTISASAMEITQTHELPEPITGLAVSETILQLSGGAVMSTAEGTLLVIEQSRSPIVPAGKIGKTIAAVRTEPEVLTLDLGERGQLTAQSTGGATLLTHTDAGGQAVTELEMPGDVTVLAGVDGMVWVGTAGPDALYTVRLD